MNKIKKIVFFLIITIFFASCALRNKSVSKNSVPRNSQPEYGITENTQVVVPLAQSDVSDVKDSYMNSDDILVLDGDGRIDKKNYYEKTVNFGTTRVDRYDRESVQTICSRALFDWFRNPKNRDCTDSLLRFNSGNNSTNKTITYGVTKVKIPFIKEVGTQKGMSLLHLSTHIGLNNFLNNISNDDIVIFIHGFNTPFTDAAIRAAQLGHDTNFNGKVVLFSWPSDNNIKYEIEKTRAIENFSFLVTFLENIANSTDHKIHIVAHSMGAYILTNSLSILSNKIHGDPSVLSNRLKSNGEKIFNQIILAAPDIAKSDFEKLYTTSKLANMAQNFTLYSTSNDYVLDMAQVFNSFGMEDNSEARLGDSDGDFFIIEGMDTIDSRNEISAQFFGHSFFAEYRGLVSDIHNILQYGAKPDKRMLQKVYDKNNNELWFIKN